MKNPRVDIHPVFGTLLPPDIIVDHDLAHIKVDMTVERLPKNSGLRIPVLLLAIYHTVCLHHLCTLIVRQMKMVEVAVGTSIKTVLTMFPYMI